MDYRKLFLEHLDLVDRTSRHVAQLHHLSMGDAEEFSSIVRLKLIDDDFAVLRKFQGRSNLSTYLITGVERICLDFCSRRWGKWRPSAAAQRLGRAAVLLEQLIHRDRLTFEEAAATLEGSAGVSETRDELQAIARRLPIHRVHRLADEEELVRVNAAVGRTVAALSSRDQLILKLRYYDGVTIADIARMLQLEPRQLYKRLHALSDELRASLLQEGITSTDIDRIAAHPDFSLGGIFYENAATE